MTANAFEEDKPMKFQKGINLLLAFVLCLPFLTSCGKKDTTSKEVPQVPNKSSASVENGTKSGGSVTNTTDTTSSTKAGVETENSTEASIGKAEAEPANTISASYDTTCKMDVTKVDFKKLRRLNNKAVPYGFSIKDRDNLNRPTGIYYYDDLYKNSNSYTHVDTEEKVVYLTMDEGYENGYTPEILDTLRRKGVHAVFPITKQFLDENPDLVQRMIDEGHIVANHTCAHPSGGLPQLGTQGMYDDIKRLNDLVYEKYDYQMKLFRFPEGVASKRAVQLVNEMGYKTLFWSFAYRDFDIKNQMDKSDALKRCLDQIHPGAIYLLHAVSATNTAILGDFIDGARERGYRFGDFPVE